MWGRYRGVGYRGQMGPGTYRPDPNAKPKPKPKPNQARTSLALALTLTLTLALRLTLTRHVPTVAARGVQGVPTALRQGLGLGLGLGLAYKVCRQLLV